MWNLHENGVPLLECQYFIIFQLCCFRLGPLILHLLFALQTLNLINSLPLAGPGCSMDNGHTFLYFAYGSNLLKERLQLKNPSAISYCVASLEVTPASTSDSTLLFAPLLLPRHTPVSFLRTSNWCLETTKACPVTDGTAA